MITGEGPAGIDAKAEFGGVFVGSHPGESSKELLIPCKIDSIKSA